MGSDESPVEQRIEAPGDEIEGASLCVSYGL